MEQAIRELNKQFEYEPVVENGPIKPAKRVIIAGMGGSHLAADIIKAQGLCSDLVVHKDYGLPCVPGDDFSDSILIANSYSGNTEEILDFFNQALDSNLNVVAVSTGGELIKIAKEKGIPYVQMPATGIQPRSALGYNVRALLKAAGLDSILEITNNLVDLDPSALEEKGKELAEKLKGKIPVIYSSSKNEAIAANWKVKINETAKIPAFYNIFPELNHNEMIGFDTKISDVGLANKFHFIFLKDKDDHHRVIKRMEVMEKLLGDRNLSVESVGLGSEERFHQIFEALILADWTTYWIAKTNNVDPEEVPLVEEFKKLIKYNLSFLKKGGFLIASAHILTGAAAGAAVVGFGKKNRNLLLVSICVFLLGVISHWTLDLIPHVEYSIEPHKVGFIVIFTIELALSLFLVFISSIDMLSSRKGLLIMGTGIIGASFPDIPDVFYRTLGLDWPWITSWMEFNGFFHAGPETQPIASMAIQFLIAALGCVFLHSINLFYRKKQIQEWRKGDGRKTNLG